MTIDETIEILSRSAFTGITTFNKKYKQAQKLAIEALKEKRAFIEKYGYEYYKLLLGEVKEGGERKS